MAVFLATAKRCAVINKQHQHYVMMTQILEFRIFGKSMITVITHSNFVAFDWFKLVMMRTPMFHFRSILTQPIPPQRLTSFAHLRNVDLQDYAGELLPPPMQDLCHFTRSCGGALAQVCHFCNFRPRRMPRMGCHSPCQHGCGAHEFGFCVGKEV